MNEEKVPYAPDFSPVQMAKAGVHREDQVLPWLLGLVEQGARKQDVMDTIVAEGFSHGNATERDRRDMASHVVQALGNYLLVDSNDAGWLTLSEFGRDLIQVGGNRIDRAFARHILTRCNGLRLVNAIREYERRGTTPRLEQLARRLDTSGVAKSISSMKAWLSRAGVFDGARYSVNEVVVADILGEDVETVAGLDATELEFVLAARVLHLQSGNQVVDAADAADLAESRSPELDIPRKSLSQWVKKLEARGVLVSSMSSGKGGTRRGVEVGPQFLHAADEELRGVHKQSDFGFPLTQLRPLAEVHAAIGTGKGHQLGVLGEMLAVHLCLMLGLQVRHWRKRAPEAEIDLIADRVADLSYQRWAIQAKNVAPYQPVSSDRVDREIGAVSGLGVSHVLIVAPRARLTKPARGEAVHRSRLTGMHVYYLDADAFTEEPSGPHLLRVLRGQRDILAGEMRNEAERREGGY
ncbi:MAG: hypothetical protein AAGA48_41060 [Myxococcota bacterium]